MATATPGNAVELGGHVLMPGWPWLCRCPAALHAFATATQCQERAWRYTMNWSETLASMKGGVLTDWDAFKGGFMLQLKQSKKTRNRNRRREDMK